MKCDNILNQYLENILNILDLNSIHIYTPIYTQKHIPYKRARKMFVINTHEHLNTLLFTREISEQDTGTTKIYEYRNV